MQQSGYFSEYHPIDGVWTICRKLL